MQSPDSDGRVLQRLFSVTTPGVSTPTRDVREEEDVPEGELPPPANINTTSNTAGLEGSPSSIVTPYVTTLVSRDAADGEPTETPVGQSSPPGSPLYGFAAAPSAGPSAGDFTPGNAGQSDGGSVIRFRSLSPGPSPPPSPTSAAHRSNSGLEGSHSSIVMPYIITLVSRDAADGEPTDTPVGQSSPQGSPLYGFAAAPSAGPTAGGSIPEDVGQSEGGSVIRFRSLSPGPSPPPSPTSASRRRPHRSSGGDQESDEEGSTTPLRCSKRPRKQFRPACVTCGGDNPRPHLHAKRRQHPGTAAAGEAAGVSSQRRGPYSLRPRHQLKRPITCCA